MTIVTKNRDVGVTLFSVYLFFEQQYFGGLENFFPARPYKALPALVFMEHAV